MIDNALLENELQNFINKYLPRDGFKQVYEYSLLPAGKMFRPRLVMATALDNGPLTNNHKLLAASVEIHHTYTLMHDDLPSMDDDDERRGRASSHKKFNEWSALLGGDGLLNLSYQLISKIDHSHTLNLLKIYSHLLGPKGLIRGQYLDLSGEMTKSFENLLETHRLKTARLIQVSLVGGYLLTENANYRSAKEYYRLGNAIGILFQFFDDLTELVDEQLSEHENDVNPWPSRYDECFKEVEGQIKILSKFLAHKKNLQAELGGYFKKIENILIENQKTIESHTKQSLVPVMSLLKSIS